jgi:hypothetical protein
MPVWIRLALVSALTAVVLGVVAHVIRSGRPRQLNDGSGTITPEKSSAAFTVIGGGAMAVLGFGAFLAGTVDEMGMGLVLGCMGLAIGGFMAPSLTHIHDVHWSEFVIEGPSRMFGPTLGLARTSIAWSDVVRTGSTMTGYRYVETLDGRRVYWSYLYKGNTTLEAALALRCPSDAIRASAMSYKHWGVVVGVATTAAIWMAHLASYFNYYWTFWFTFVAALALSRYVLTRYR